MARKKESEIQSEIIKYLKKQGIFCWRNNNTAVYDPKINGYRSFTGLKGVPDILGILPGGIFIGVEVKTPRGKQSADQVLFERRCKRLGGVYIVARSVKDITDNIKDHLG